MRPVQYSHAKPVAHNLKATKESPESKLKKVNIELDGLTLIFPEDMKIEVGSLQTQHYGERSYSFTDQSTYNGKLTLKNDHLYLWRVTIPNGTDKPTVKFISLQTKTNSLLGLSSVTVSDKQPVCKYLGPVQRTGGNKDSIGMRDKPVTYGL